MINLAALRYRKIFAAEGGPVDRIEMAEIQSETGGRQFQANAFLSANLLPPRRHTRRVYSEASGSGTHRSPLIARFIAISEAMERWAYAATAPSADRARYGFEVDPMSNGMAAFPGWYRAQARPTAQFEAIERFNLTAWWEGLLPAITRSTEWPNVSAVVIGSDQGSVTVVLHKPTSDGQHAYGHAAAGSFGAACRKAAVELMRHERVIQGFHRKQRAGSVAALAAPTDQLERRSLFFATAEGYESFLRRLEAPPAKLAPERKVAFDGPIPGPWTKYADVWRVVYYPVSLRYLTEGDNYFLW